MLTFDYLVRKSSLERSKNSGLEGLKSNKVKEAPSRATVLNDLHFLISS